MRKQKGYVLLVVLAMLTIAALISAGVARRGLDMSVAVAQKQIELQRRWGEISCRQAVLNRAEILLRTAELQNETNVFSLQTTVQLGDLTFTLVLSDEQAKLNLNTVFRYADLEKVRQAVSNQETFWQTHLRPDSRASKNSLYPPAFSAWGQVFDFSHLSEEPEKNDVRLQQPGSRITCWGNGLLNIRRSDPFTLRTMCELMVPPQSASRFIECNQEKPNLSFDELLKTADITDHDRRALRKVLTDKSRCHSLWLVTKDSQRSWVRLDIRTTDISAGNDTLTFYW